MAICEKAARAARGTATLKDEGESSKSTLAIGPRLY
jgi:hypothetical protein